MAFGKENNSTPASEPVPGADKQTSPKLLYSYLCHPARRNRRITIMATSAIVICLLLVWLVSSSILLTILGAVILFGSLGSFYFPTRYFFYDDHLVVKTGVQTLRKKWNVYRSYYPDRNGVLLSPFGRPTRLENFRGLYIKFEGNRDKVMEIVRSHIDYEEET